MELVHAPTSLPFRPSRMFLKTVPPAVAIHSEWRSSKSCSLPLFFNDSASDSDLASVNGTPIPQKIQMIIESLHSTQSSDMTDNAQDAHSSHDAGCKGQARVADTSARSRRTDARRQTAGEDSDSDDSVDRGIEEAIQEYLKEKVDHKRKGDPVTGSSPVAKLPRREPSTPDVARQHTHSSSGKVLTASNHIQRASTQPLKKKVKQKTLSKENPFKKADLSKSVPVKSPLSRCKKGSSSSSEIDRSPPRLIIKEEFLDSSSDDGIEEEIQRFQKEKKVQQESEKDTSRHPRRTEDSDSSSDEGIEEAIRRFQAEKHKKNKKSLLKPAQPVPVHRIAQPLKPLSKKNNKKKLMTKESDRPASLTISQFLSKCSSQSSKVKALAAPPISPRTTDTEHQIHSSLNVNTADLMCAEAILDISKTVMPEVFETNFNQTFPAADDKSNDSSVDSEDGIEQEIRKFLELKAQMNKEPALSSEDPAASKEPKKKTGVHSSKIRLSLSRKRKLKEEQSKPSTDGDVAHDVKEELSGKTSVRSESTRSQISSPGICASLTVKNNKPRPVRKMSDGYVYQDKGSLNVAIGSERNDSSDKSSSLDSDEDLDAAIKDLLKTKKKVKKKVRDMRARKGPSEALSTKPKLTTEQKNTPHVKTLRSTLQPKSNKSPWIKAGMSKPDHGLKERDQECVLPSSIQQANDDDSCVDSDDSIEQEIRRFLAERAKVATPVCANIKQEDGEEEEYLPTDADVKLEHQQIPIEAPARLQNNETQTGMQSGGLSLCVKRQTDSTAEADNGPVLAPGGSCVEELSRNLEISDTREQKNGKSTPVNHTTVKSSTLTSATPQTSDQHQNLFLMTSGNSKMNELTECQQSRPAPRIPLSEVIKSVCLSPFSKTKPPESSCPATTTGGVLSSTTPDTRTDEVYVHNHVDRDKKDKPPAVHKDQTPFPSFSSQKTNHLQVIKSKPSEYRVSLEEEQREGGDKKEEKEQGAGMKEEEEEKCLDETDVESDENREDQKMKAARQHQPSQ